MITYLVIGVLVLDKDVENGSGVWDGDLRLLGIGRLDNVVLGERGWQDTPNKIEILKQFQINKLHVPMTL